MEQTEIGNVIEIRENDQESIENLFENRGNSIIRGNKLSSVDFLQLRDSPAIQIPISDSYLKSIRSFLPPPPPPSKLDFLRSSFLDSPSFSSSLLHSLLSSIDGFYLQSSSRSGMYSLGILFPLPSLIFLS